FRGWGKFRRSRSSKPPGRPRRTGPDQERTSERDFVVQVARTAAATRAAATGTAAAEGVVRARLSEVRAAPVTAAATARIAGDLPAFATLPARVEHLQFTPELLQHDLGGIPFDTVLLPFAGLEGALDINLHALLEVLFRDLAQS